MNKPLLISFLGFPGSGKTYFSRNLANKLNAVTFNTDALRISIFGSLERIDQIRQQDRSRIYEDVFGAMSYAARQTLRAGYSVIYDAQMTKKVDRNNIEQIALSARATPILVWVQTSRDTAIRRAQEREPDDDSNRYDQEKAIYLINRFNDITEFPDLNENVIKINGEIIFDEQYISFMDQLSQLTSR